MRNIWHVFRRDLRRILIVPQAWIILLGLIVTPALYAWVNVIAFWDPYSKTANISVAVTNLDEGATSELTGDVNVGAQVVEELKQNDQLGWTFVDEDEAEARVKRGDSYAAIVIPADFSSNLLSITSGDFTQPKVEYFVNEKANAVAPKLTDVGAQTLVQQITSSFTATVAEAAADALSDVGTDAQDKLEEGQRTALQTLDEASSSIEEGKQSLQELQDDLATARENLTDAKATLADVDTALQASQKAISQSQAIAAQAQQDLTTFGSQFSSSFADATRILANVSSQSQGGLADLNVALQGANTHVGTAIDGVAAVVESNGRAIDQIQELISNGGLDPAVVTQLNQVLDALNDRNAADQELLTSLQALDLGGTSNDAVQAVADAATALDSALQNTSSNADTVRDLLLDGMPKLNQQLSTLSGSASGFAAALQAQRSQLASASGLLDSLDSQLADTSTALGGMMDNLSGFQDSLGTLRTDVVALGSASVWDQLNSITNLNAQQIASFMTSPVEVNEKVVFPVNSYGSGMAALFTNLSLWIGAFVLMVIMKLEVDDEGVPGLTVRQAYLGRWLLLAVISALQGLLVTFGNLIIGVQTVNPVAFVATGVFIALTYLSIIYALSVTFAHIGKGLCVIFVIVQIPGASGLYPIEMMPSFFQNLYPFFPFTYGIDAMRETIAGFYDGHYWQRLSVLTLFVAAAFILGLLLRSKLVTITRLFNKGIVETNLLVAEEVNDSGTYRLSQALRSLANREDYRHRLERRAATFARYYPRLRRGGLIAGFIMPVVLTLIPASDPSVKALVLGLWVAWFLLLFGYLIVIEYIRDAIEDGLELTNMPDNELHQAIEGRRKRRPAGQTKLHPLIEGSETTQSSEATEVAQDTHRPEEAASSKEVDAK
ncbi:YhgE/Pip domain-containing protein [Changpingibacter yushuensis]|uniref:YhgE/Pip domain-containing protein n=1 Tax=Changpingibacter yushuensis TaxID=2758440 RepID=UPI0015F450C5|nr:YhgE/Pip domain-containing protein [Changpingibacter yushuensis]